MTKARDLANSAAAFAAVSATELGYVDGVTSAIQTQMDAKAPSSTAATLSGTQTLTNKTIDTASNTITGAVTLTGTQTLTNKTLTSPVIASVINNTLTSTTGDIIYASAANTPARLGIGSSAQVLTVASGIPSWATPAGGASMTLLSTTTLSGATVTVSSISQSYTHLQIYIDSVTNATGDGAFRIGINGSNNYAYFVKNYKGTAGNEDAGWVAPNNTYTRTNTTNFQHYNIYNYATNTGWKTFDGCGGFFMSNDYQQFQNGGYIYTAGQALSSLVFSNSGGNLSTGTVRIYGVN
jgi:hypothetical protein